MPHGDADTVSDDSLGPAGFCHLAESDTDMPCAEDRHGDSDSALEELFNGLDKDSNNADSGRHGFASSEAAKESLGFQAFDESDDDLGPRGFFDNAEIAPGSGQETPAGEVRPIALVHAEFVEANKGRGKGWRRGLRGRGSLSRGSGQEPLDGDITPAATMTTMCGFQVVTDLVPKGLAQTQLVRCVARPQKSLGAVDVESHQKLIEGVLTGDTPRQMAPISVEAAKYGIPRQNFAEKLKCTAESFLQGWQLFLQGVCGRIRECEASWRPKTAWRRQMGDETPTKLRLDQMSLGGAATANVGDEVASVNDELRRSGLAASENVKKKAETAKVVQTDLHFACLLQSVATGRRLVLRCSKPSRLQVVDHCTGETLREVFNIVWGRGEMTEFLKLFECVIDISTLDRAASNRRFDAFMTGSPTEFKRYKRLTLWCDMHRLMIELGTQFAICSLTISGVVNLSLSLRAGGAVDMLRDVIASFIRLRLKVFMNVAAPGPGTEVRRYSEAWLRTYVSNSSYGETGCKRACSLRRNLNGNLLRKGYYEHYCNGCHSSEEEAISCLVSELPLLLVPHAVPDFPRHRWFRSDQSLDAVGSLDACGTLEYCVPVCRQCLSQAQYVVTAASFAPAPEDVEDIVAVDDLGQAGFENKIGNGLAGDLLRGADLDEFSLEEEDSGIAAPNSSKPVNTDGSVDWAEFNRRTWTSTAQFASSGAGFIVAVLRVALSPAYKAMGLCKQMSGTLPLHQPHLFSFL